MASAVVASCPRARYSALRATVCLVAGCEGGIAVGVLVGAARGAPGERVSLTWPPRPASRAVRPRQGAIEAQQRAGLDFPIVSLLRQPKAVLPHPGAVVRVSHQAVHGRGNRPW